MGRTGFRCSVCTSNDPVKLAWAATRESKRSNLAIHEKGVRWANNYVLLDQIASLSVGTETFREQHFPTLNVLWKSHWRHGEGMKKAEEREKAATLAFHLKVGGITQWRNFGQCFSPETQQEFFEEFASMLGGSR